MGLVIDLLFSPIAWALAAIIGLYFLAITFIPAPLIHLIQDCFATSAGAVVVTVYGRAWWAAVRERRPSAIDVIVVGVGAVAFGYTSLRMLRILWHEIGRPSWVFESSLFGLATSVMLFGALCHLAARGNPNGHITRKGWMAIFWALISGCALSAFMIFRNWTG